MDEVLARLLHERVLGYLDAVDHLAASENSRTTSFEARRLAAAWRALLSLHDLTNGCKTCTKGNRMCSVWRVACAYFIHRLPWDRHHFKPRR